MIDPKLNDLPTDVERDLADVPESSLTEEQRAQRLRRSRAGLSINDTIAADTTTSVGGRGVDVSGVKTGAGAGGGMTNATPAAPGESPMPDLVEGPHGTGMTPQKNSDFDKK